MSTCQNVVYFDKGSSWRRRFVFKKSSKPMKLQLSSVEFQIKDLHSYEDVYITDSSSSEVTIFPEDGFVDIKIEPVKQTMLASNYRGRLVITHFDGTIQPTPWFLVNITQDSEQKVPNITNYDLNQQIVNNITAKRY